MDRKTMKAIDQFIEAKQLEKDAICSLLPDNMKGHIDIISREVSAMILECVASKAAPDHEGKKDKADQPSVKKVFVE